MTSTRTTIPAPPPNGVSSSTRPLSVVWSRGLSVRSSCPRASALLTWRWVRNHSNHSGKRVTTSSCTQELPVHGDRAPLDVDPQDRVAHHRDQLAGVELERLARRQRDEPHDRPEHALAGDRAAADQVLGPVLVLAERWRFRALDDALAAAQRDRVGAVVGHVEPEDRLLVAALPGDDHRLVVADADRRPDAQQLRGGLGHVEVAVEAMGTA